MNTKTNYSELLKDPRWQKKRLKILERDEWKCTVCSNAERTLHVHHLQYQGLPWECPDKYLITLCSSCHETEEKAGRENPAIKDLALRINKPCLFIYDRMVIICHLFGLHPEEYKKIEDLFKGRGKEVNFDIDWH